MEMIGESQGTKRKYFVSYTYRTVYGDMGIAHSSVEVNFPISDLEAIQTISECLISNNPEIKAVVIHNWKKFEDPE
jgi:hypothetical protein